LPPEGALSVEDVEAAQRRIAGLVVRTPVVPSPGLRRRTGTEVGLKLESLQPTASFKVRGAASRLRALDPVTARRGVVTASTGNHGRAVAHVARELSIPATVCLSERVPPGKVTALEELGCRVLVGGTSQTDALVTAARLVEEDGLTLVHPFDDPDVIAGQGTIGLELVEQQPATTTVLVPLSGGGLLAGVALAVRARRPDVRVVGVSMEHGAVMATSLTRGRPVELAEEATLADSLQGGIGSDNRYTFALVRDLVDEVVLVPEQDIWDGMRFALDHHRIVLEGAAAVGIAALLAGRVEAPGPVTVICSGGNAERRHVEALARGEAAPPG
jgi:threonine dehydratase